MRQVWLGDGDAGLEDREELLAAVEPLSRRHRRGRGPDEVADEVRVLWDDRLLEEERPVRLEKRSDALGGRQTEPAVEVDGHIALLAEDLARGLDTADDSVDLGE